MATPAPPSAHSPTVIAHHGRSLCTRAPPPITSPLTHPGVLGVQLTVRPRRVLVQWNAALSKRLVHLGIDAHRVCAAQSARITRLRPTPPALSAAEAAAAAAAASAGGGTRLRLKMEGGVEEVTLCLNLDGEVPPIAPLDAPLDAGAGMEEAAPPARVDVLLRLRASCHSMYLQLDEEGQLQLRLGAVSGTQWHSVALSGTQRLASYS